jgi:hypothetical protein
MSKFAAVSPDDEAAFFKNASFARLVVARDM